MPEEPRTIFFVRHAEKRTDEPRDPSLSEHGRARAALLAEMLRSVEVTHLFATEYRRTQETLQPLAAASGLEVRVIPAREPEVQISALRQLEPGAVAVVAGHSNTVPHLLRTMGARVEASTETANGLVLDEDEYDRLFVLILRGAREGSTPQLLELHFGARSESLAR